MAKSILITGCSSGIGYDAAVALHRRGWQVFATCRQDKDVERLREEGLTSFRLDYSDSDSIETSFAAALEATGGTLDAVYNNGAYAIPGLLEDLPTDALRAIFETNLFGYHALNRRVIPVMRAQGHGRIIQCSSILGLVAAPWRGAYNATKFALEGLTDTLRMELHGTGIHVVLIEPGPVTSRIRQNAVPHFEKWIDWENAAETEYYRLGLRKRLYEDKGPDQFELPPSAVTKKLIRALESPRPHPRYYVTFPTYLAGFLRRISSTRVLDRFVRRNV